MSRSCFACPYSTESVPFRRRREGELQSCRPSGKNGETGFEEAREGGKGSSSDPGWDPCPEAVPDGEPIPATFAPVARPARGGLPERRRCAEGWFPVAGQAPPELPKRGALRRGPRRRCGKISAGPLFAALPRFFSRIPGDHPIRRSRPGTSLAGDETAAPPPCPGTGLRTRCRIRAPERRGAIGGRRTSPRLWPGVSRSDADLGILPDMPCPWFGAGSCGPSGSRRDRRTGFRRGAGRPWRRSACRDSG